MKKILLLLLLVSSFSAHSQGKPDPVGIQYFTSNFFQMTLIDLATGQDVSVGQVGVTYGLKIEHPDQCNLGLGEINPYYSVIHSWKVSVNPVTNQSQNCGDVPNLALITINDPNYLITVAPGRPTGLGIVYDHSKARSITTVPGGPGGM